MTDIAEATLNPAGAHVEHTEAHFDYSATKMGMWLFLFTELLLFGGMFISYAVYRFMHPEDFHNAAHELNLAMGLINTLVLLTSSMTVAMAVSAVQKGHVKLSLGLVFITIVFACVFLVIKYFEWTAKFHHGLYPGAAELAKHPVGEQQFFGLYFTMTGLHGLHVIIGGVVLAIVGFIIHRRPLNTVHISPREHLYEGSRIVVKGAKGDELWSSESIGEETPDATIQVHHTPSQARMGPKEYVLLENAALYWHLVDIIWIFLFPLFYLIT